MDAGAHPWPEGLAAFATRLDAASEAAPGGEDVLVVVAHPDDETIGLGGQLPRLRQATIVHVTDGAPRNGFDARAYGFDSPAQYAAARRRELEGAVALAGIPRDRLLSLGVPDQEAPGRMAEIARRLADIVLERQPTFLLTHPFEGGHPDHDATALAVWCASRLAEAKPARTGEVIAPVVIEMASYHLGPGGPVFQRFAGERPELVMPLDERQSARKRAMLAAHASQSRTLEPFHADEERFRLAADYDWESLPNGGRLHYETMPWGLRGVDWLRLARQGRAELGLAEKEAAA